MSLYQITHYWSDDNTFPDIISRNMGEIKDNDILKALKSKFSDKNISKEIELINSDLNMELYGIEIVFVDDEQYTINEFYKKFPDKNIEDYYIRFYGWEFNKVA